MSDNGVDDSEAGPAEVVEGEDDVGPLCYVDEVPPSRWGGGLLALNRVNNQPREDVEGQTYAICHKHNLREPLHMLGKRERRECGCVRGSTGREL